MGEEAEEKPRVSPAMMQNVVQYFKKEGYKVEQNETVLDGFSGITRKFDLIVKKGQVEHGVWIREWNRTIGVNVVINVDRASEDVGLSTPILVGDKFSDHAKSYANRRKLTLLTRRQMGQSLR
jgi:galactitol-specific phosphotransferase system IIB component